MRKRTSKRVRICSKQTTKKYTTRNSPPYSAVNCQNKKIKGNDGNLYISLSSGSGIYKWYPYSSELVKKNKDDLKKILAHAKTRRREMKKNKSMRRTKRRTRQR